MLKKRIKRCALHVALLLKKKKSSRADATFVKGGFSNWRKAVEKCTEHERSSFHLESMNKIAALSSTPINALMSDIVAKEQKTAQMVLELAFRSIK